MKKRVTTLIAVVLGLIVIVALGQHRDNGAKTNKTTATSKVVKRAVESSKTSSSKKSDLSMTSSSSDTEQKSSTFSESTNSAEATSSSADISTDSSSNIDSSPAYDPNRTLQGVEVTSGMIAETRRRLIAAGLPADQWAPSDIKKIITEASQQNISVVDYAKDNFHN
ncbi:hypothetical protein LH61_06355 [Leuconostoc mesenteroides P45]|uniref:hypothetical protein n=1 Tax=Leuconostoc mesenteroides TaxID=1245 RepID=UPI000503A26B|nr:hypothetical protein [Leuconostoc mesenteroides]KGB51093.1 hypothetical protein LH61_06355 [Leuconostoc mesenteroides P45]